LIKKPSPTASDENKSFEKVKKDLEDLGLELCYIPDFLDLNYNNVLLENYGPE
jgi:hypothetical protein